LPEENILCGSIPQEEVRDFFLEFLKPGEDNRIPHLSLCDNNLVGLVSRHPEQAAYALLHLLESLDLIEHGISARCSWLTAKGLEFLDEVKKWKDEEQEIA